MNTVLGLVRFNLGPSLSSVFSSIAYNHRQRSLAASSNSAGSGEGCSSHRKMNGVDCRRGRKLLSETKTSIVCLGLAVAKLHVGTECD